MLDDDLELGSKLYKAEVAKKEVCAVEQFQLLWQLALAQPVI